MFSEIAAGYRLLFRPFSLYPPAAFRKEWENLDPDWKREAIGLGENYLGFQYPALFATDFLDFTRTGNRVRYEDKLFSKRLALNALVLAECVENKGRFLDDILNGIFSICEESAWQLPAHNSYIQDAPQLPLPDAAAPVLDLFACETGAVLATASYLLRDALDKISPFVTRRIFDELSRRIFTPYLQRYFWWMGDGKGNTNNWTVWCTQNVLLCVFLTDTETPFRRDVLKKACQSIDYFLDGYGRDGCCDEGASYYRHAGLCLFNAMEILNNVTDGAFVHLYQNSKIQNIASYILNVHVEDKYYVNFADCSPIAGRAGVREFLFAQRTDNKNMAAFAAADYGVQMPDSLQLSRENNLYYRLQNGFTAKEIKAAAPGSADGIPHPDICYPSVGLFIARDDRLLLAVKAGDNGDSHNHNDVGSFTVYKDGLPLLIDVGVESYTQKTFSPRRYEIWTMQSAYHNLPTVNGIMQKDGEACRAKEVRYQISDALCEIDMDIAGAYPAESGLQYYRRKASLIKGKEILIKDSFSFQGGAACLSADNDLRKNSVVLSFMTYEKPVLRNAAPDSPKALVFSVSSLGTLAVTGGEKAEIETIPITDARLKTAWEHEIYRILITAVNSEMEIKIF